MDDLVQWLRAQLDEDERILREANTSPEMVTGIPRSYAAAPVALHIGEFAGPERVLREIAAKRSMLAIHRPYVPEPDQACLGCADAIMFRWCPIVRLLALPYADRPGYRPEWAPTR
ncbi:DUF6221 family protein [Streptomyces sp. NPDC048504]|uniref:DUF6221 family protein n=1 Tax=Streptomyces sp. NPDC048504 TaxID=3365559 RepID=UPI003712054E